MEKLDLSKKNNKIKSELISLGEVNSFLNEMCEPSPAKRPKEKKEKKDNSVARLSNNLSLKKEDKVIPSLAPIDFVPNDILAEIDVEDILSSMAPNDYVINKVEPEEDLVLIESETPDDYVAPPNEVEKKVVSYNTSIVPENFDPEKGLIEEEKEFVYEIPEGFEPKVEIVEEKEEEEPKEELTEEVIEQPKSAMDVLADRVGSLVKNLPKEQEAAVESILEHKVLQLEKALYDTRRMVLEMGHGTMVSGLGGVSGGGEVRLFGLDDVNVGSVQDGDSLIWDSTLGQWIPSSADGTTTLDSLTRQVGRMESKFISFDDRIQKLLALDTKFLELEDNTTEDGTPQGEPRGFFDLIPEGDTTTFVVTQNEQRNVYELDGIPQPTVQLPRGDIIIFDISQLDDPSTFEIYQNGIILQTGRTRDDTAGSETVTIHTGLVDAQFSKLYYRHTTINGLGWIIQITSN